jgi:hypothetical protein
VIREPSVIMRLFRTRLHVYISLVFLACVVTAVIVILMLPRERVTRANYDKIEIGMSVADVESLLGPPDFRWIGPILSKYTVEYPPGHGWSSPEVTILVMPDANGRIVYRRCADGQPRASAFEMVWAEIHSWICGCF